MTNRTERMGDSKVRNQRFEKLGADVEEVCGMSICATCDQSYDPDNPEEALLHEHPEPQSGEFRAAWLRSGLHYQAWLDGTYAGKLWEIERMLYDARMPSRPTTLERVRAAIEQAKAGQFEEGIDCAARLCEEMAEECNGSYLGRDPELLSVERARAAILRGAAERIRGLKEIPF